MVALRLAYSARPAPTLLPARPWPVGRWLRQAWCAYWAAMKTYAGDHYGVPRPPLHHH